MKYGLISGLFAAVILYSGFAVAGSPDYNVSLYSCSDVFLGSEAVGDNCLANYDDKLALVEGILDDGGDNSDGDPGDSDE